MQQVMAFMNEYGYWFLFLSMATGMIILPLPLEAIMGYSGYLSFEGDLDWFTCVLAAAAGTFLGMIVNYWIGKKLGYGFFKKYGHYFFLKPKTLDKLSDWFLKYGNKLLIIIFFVPGARHAIGFFAGITKFPARTYAICTALGSLIWATPFIIIGKMIGPGWMLYHEEVKNFLYITSMVLLVVFLAFFLSGKTSPRVSDFGFRLKRKLSKLIR
ncbi:DedA family protein [Neobacillus sp. SCS-31]|uniref:DedA family protein n=1 Tax=Neobacillus oceani TaxID=3115292 RepID=UPI003905DDBA